MPDISSIERRKLERLFRMSGGYVLDFSDRTFSEFFEEHTRRDIDAAIYRERGTSKANRLRGFWAVEGNHLVGKVSSCRGARYCRRHKWSATSCGSSSGRSSTKSSPC